MSSLQDRLKAFLPQMAQANKELEDRIRVEGQEAVRIDTHIKANNDIVQSDEEDENDADQEPMITEHKDAQKSEPKQTESSKVKGDGKQVKLEFVVGEIGDDIFDQLEPQSEESVDQQQG